MLIALRIFAHPIAISLAVLPLALKCAISEGKIDAVPMVKIVFYLAIIIVSILEAYLYHILHVECVLLLRLYLFFLNWAKILMHFFTSPFLFWSRSFRCILSKHFPLNLKLLLGGFFLNRLVLFLWLCIQIRLLFLCLL